MEYEYTILHISQMSLKALNDIGAAGWRLVTIFQGQGYFVREKQPAPKPARKSRGAKK